jgi:hypothetical protein
MNWVNEVTVIELHRCVTNILLIQLLFIYLANIDHIIYRSWRMIELTLTESTNYAGYTLTEIMKDVNRSLLRNIPCWYSRLWRGTANHLPPSTMIIQNLTVCTLKAIKHFIGQVLTIQLGFQSSIAAIS